MLEKKITLSNVNGRVSNICVNAAGHIAYVAAIEDNSVQIIDLNTGIVVHSIKNIYEPKEILFIPKQEEIFIITGSRKCYFYSTKTFEKIAAIRLMAEANAAIYDSIEEKIYLGYGENEMIVLNTDSHKETGFTLLAGSVEYFQSDKSTGKLYINSPESYSLIMFDLKLFRAMQRFQYDYELARQIAIDTVKHRIFLCYKNKQKLLVINGKTGRKQEQDIPLKNIQNLYYHYSTHNLFISNGETINIFHEYNDGFKQVAGIKTEFQISTSTLIPELNLYILAGNTGTSNNIELAVYNIANL